MLCFPYTDCLRDTVSHYQRFIMKFLQIPRNGQPTLLAPHPTSAREEGEVEKPPQKQLRKV